MLRPLLVGALALGGCSTPGGLGNALTPDEFTLGKGLTDSNLSGATNPWYDQQGGDWPIDMEGETESTYMALTWDLPTWDSPETREDRRKIREESLILDMAAEERSLPLSRLNKTTLPPTWLFVGVAGVLAFLVIAAMKKSKRSPWR